MSTFADDGRLNAPWGVAIARARFRRAVRSAAGRQLRRAGRICAFGLASGAYMDDLRGENDKPVAIAGLWGLQFGNGVAPGDSHALYFAAGPEDETEGLFGSLRVVN